MYNNNNKNNNNKVIKVKKTVKKLNNFPNNFQHDCDFKQHQQCPDQLSQSDTGCLLCCSFTFVT